VPRRLRADWKQEWEAELRHREALLADWAKLNWRTKLNLLWRSLGAFWDAIWLQQLRWEDEMFQDLRYGLRMLIKHKGFTAVAVLSLALGIGANTAIFSLIEGVLLRPLPYPDAERMVVLWQTRVETGDNQILASWPDWVSWNEQQQAFEGIGSFQNTPAFVQVKDDSLAVEYFSTSANFFSILKVPAAFGRTFLPGDESGGPSIAVISYGLWQRAFGGDPEVLGKTVLVNDRILEVIGVMPATFVSPAGSLLPGLRLSPSDALWVPSKPNEVFHRGLRFLHSIARLKPESTLAQSQAEMSTIAARLEDQYRDTNRGYGVQVVSLHEVVVGGTRQSLLVLFGAVGLVLLIACGNVANLALARASVRQREMCIRAALGAGRVRLIRQLLTENLALAALGGAAGLVLAFWTISLVRPISLQELPRLGTLQINLTVLGFAAALSLLTGLLFGLAPAMQASNINFNEALKGGHQLTGGRFSNRFRHALIAAEVALSLVLLVGAGLLLQSFWRLQSAHGLRSPENILTLKFNLDSRNSKYNGFPNGISFYEEMFEHLRRIPGVQTVGVTTSLLQIGDPFAHPFEVEGRAPLAPTERPQAGFTMVNSEYFSLAGMRLRAGRLFTDRDRASKNTIHGPRLVIVNEALARIAFPGEDPVGKQMKVYWYPGGEPYDLRQPPPVREIVGVVTDSQPYNVGVTAKPRIYYPYSQTPENGAIVMIRTYGQTAGIFPPVRALLREMDPGIRIFEVRTVQEILDEATVKPRWSMALLTLFASVALVLAAVGIFGVVSYLVAQRTQEIGIRMALGASATHVLKLVVGQNLRVVSVGLLCGLGLTFALTRALSSLLFGITATDPATVVLSSVLLLAVALFASYLPARKASRIDPAVALRRE
jgi:putative ABC transport system permease protein